jgi:SAM-dependent methyltransferase
MKRKHLDLGCGTRPKNPYNHEELYGVDIRADIVESIAYRIAIANLIVSPIPFEENSFDSVSAFDFLEHVPRIGVDYANGITRFPFIDLMNEIWRVLKPDGMLYAVTPAYPDEKAFRDPTHVNVITKKTHRYFTEPDIMGRMYGFVGSFKVHRHCWVYPRGEYEPNPGGLGRRFQRMCDKLTLQQSHLIWEFSAIKRGS